MKLEIVDDQQNDFIGIKIYWENKGEERRLTDAVNKWEKQRQESIAEYRLKLPYFKAMAEAMANGKINSKGEKL